jgi:hypothetical protein
MRAARIRVLNSNRIVFVNRIRQAGRVALVGLAAVHTWAAVSNHSMNADGINYLDVGDAFWRGDWATAVNPVWSPLYAWLLGLAMRVFQPAMQWEFKFAHLVNFAVFIFALFCFERLWRTLWESRPGIAWAEWAWWGIGYTLFTWAALGLIEIWAVTPDMLMAAFVLLAASLLLQIRQGRSSGSTFVLFGLFLGLAYLTKAVMLPIAAVFWSSAPFRQELFPRSVGLNHHRDYRPIYRSQRTRFDSWPGLGG